MHMFMHFAAGAGGICRPLSGIAKQAHLTLKQQMRL
jgi:hypothetical protein